MRDALRGFVRLRIDVSDRSEAALRQLGRWQATALPTFIVLDRQGRELGRHVGNPPAAWFLTMADLATE